MTGHQLPVKAQQRNFKNLHSEPLPQREQRGLLSPGRRVPQREPGLNIIPSRELKGPLTPEIFMDGKGLLPFPSVSSVTNPVSSVFRILRYLRGTSGLCVLRG